MKKLAAALLAALMLTACSSTPGAATSNAASVAASQPASQPAAAMAGAVTWENATLQHYTGEGAHPYVHSTLTNGTDGTITAVTYGMLAYDAAGNPLEIDWNSLDSSSEPAYFYLHGPSSENLAPGETTNSDGGWSLNLHGEDAAVDQIAHVLYCYESLTFSDGTTWQNPQFDAWRAQYEGQPQSPASLEGYYPYTQSIEG